MGEVRKESKALYTLVNKKNREYVKKAHSCQDINKTPYLRRINKPFKCKKIYIISNIYIYIYIKAPLLHFLIEIHMEEG